MYNFSNLSDYEFERLCKDIMQKRLNCELHTFAQGRDGGIDITDDPVMNHIVIQVKRITKGSFAGLRRKLKDELDKVKQFKPDRYYICCSMKLTAANKKEIYEMFTPYMQSAGDILACSELNDFLEMAENAEIVRKHYKLWLDSTNVLNELLNQKIFIDCESLLYNMDEYQKEFVDTDCYKECIKILEEERMLLLLGMPGTGKTMTTRMLALYFAANEYRIRYTTNGDLGDLKNALSSDKDKKEVILLDDCLGQHYFRMKEVKPGELLSLIKYIAMNKQKMLIMNSRVTIFQEAKEQSVELKQFAEDERFRIKILDMNRLSVVDKGRILRNHLFAKEVPEEYYRDICRDRNYSKIVQHKNYTPRIMEYVTRKANYKDVQSEKYYLFIADCLNNPREIWRDEFMNRIRPEDRIFLTTLYSLTDTTIELPRLQRAFYKRIKNEIQIDTSHDVWESVLRRLEGAFIILIDRNGQKEIGVLNPSVNDFLKEYLEENVPERENIRRCAIDARQVERGFSDEIKNLLETGRILEFYFENNEDRYNMVVNGICDYGVLHERYKNLIRDFMNDLAEKILFYVKRKYRMFVILLSEQFDQVYETRKNLDKDKMEIVLGSMELEEFKTFIWTVERQNGGFLYDEYGEEIAEALSVAMTGYAYNVPAIDYLGYSDIQEAMELNLVEYDGDIDVDEQAVEEMLEDELTRRVREDMFDMTADMPDPWGKRVREEIEEIDIYIDGVGTCIDNFGKDRGRAYTGELQQEDSVAEKILDEIFR